MKKTIVNYSPVEASARLISFAVWTPNAIRVFENGQLESIIDLYSYHSRLNLLDILWCGKGTLADINRVMTEIGFPDLDAFREAYQDAFYDTEVGASSAQIAVVLSACRGQDRIDKRWFTAIIQCQHLAKSSPSIPRSMFVACMRTI